MANFTDVLNTPAETIVKPKPRPLGAYFAVVQGLPKQRTITSSGANLLDYNFKVTGVKQLNDPSIDPGEVSQWAPMQKGFFVETEENQWAHSQFLTNTLGIDASGGKTVGEMMAQAPGKQVVVTLKHEPYVDSNGEAQIATRIDRVVKA